MTVRELNGWTPATVALDRDGNVQSVTVTGSRFAPGDVDLLLASRRQDHDRNEYGIPYGEAMDKANQFRFKPMYRTDWSVESVRRAQATMRAANKDVDLSALRWSVEKS